MSFFDKNLDGNLPDGSSDTGGNATPTPKTPTNKYLPRNRHMTPSPHHSRPWPIAAGPSDSGTSQQDLRHIWEDANRPAQQTSTIPHVGFQRSPDNSDYSSTTAQRETASMHAHVNSADMASNYWEPGLERLSLADSMPQQTRLSTDAPKSFQQSSFSYGARPGAGSAIPPAVETAAQPRHLSIWSTYGGQISPSSSARNDGISGIAPMTNPYSSHPAPRLAGMGVSPNYRARISSETSFNTSTNLPHTSRPFASQASSYIPMRMGQSQHSGPESYPPEPYYLQPRNQRFLPMHAVRTGQQPPCSVPAYVASSGVAKPVPSSRFSDRYHGMHTESNASAEHLSAEQNTSLWITNLPPDITHHELLGQIRRIGRIWCCFINGPDGIKHTTAAAKVVFFHPGAAQSLLQHAAEHGLVVRGIRAKVTQNRIKTGETIPRGGNDSRVLIVTGHADFVNEKTLTEYFSRRFVFQIDEVRELISGGGRAVIEFRFGSYRCQSQMGKISLEKDRPLGFEKAEFGEDPCEVGETWSSHSVALQRIRGIGI